MDKRAILACLKAGQAIMDIYNDKTHDFGVELKSDRSPLTKADRKAHQIIFEHLQETGVPILSEEGASIPYEQRREWTKFWLVDPLDGTKEFIKKNGEFTVNIALIEEGIPTQGYVYLPAKDKLYAVGPSGKAMLYREASSARWQTESGEALPLCEAQHSDFVIMASRSHLSPETASFIEQMKKEHDELRIMSSGSSIKICQVAEGSAEVYPRFAPTMEWDTAAADAIARACGKACYACDSEWATTELKPLVYNKPDLHNPWFLVR